MNRKQFLSYLLLSAASTSLKAQYPEKTLLRKKEEQLNYILLNLYESPPRWLFDLPLKPSDKDKVITNPMLSTCYTNGKLKYRTIKMKGLNMPSLWENPIPTANGKMVPMENILQDALIIRGCNMNKDGHDVNSKSIESDSEGKVSLGGRIASHHPSRFPAISVSGKSGPFKGTVSAFLTEESLKSLDCISKADQSYLEQVLSLYEQTPEENSSHEPESRLKELLAKINLALGEESPLTYTQIKSLQKLPFNEIYRDFLKSKKKYLSLIEKTLFNLKIKDISGATPKGISFPISFELNESKSHSPLDYMGAYRFEDYIISNQSIEDIFSKVNSNELADRMALCEVALSYELTSVLLINIDSLKNIQLKKAVPVDKISSKVDGNKITFSCADKDLYTSKEKGEDFTNDCHFIGTHASLVGYSLLYYSFATCLNEFQTFLKATKRYGQTLYDRSLIHLTSEFERAPQTNQAGSDHGWKGHTSTLISGKFRGLNLFGNIKIKSPNTVNDLNCTWGEGAYLPGLKRQMRYGDIIHSISHIFNVTPTTGGANLLKIKNNKYITRFNHQHNRGS
jgi:hypothetical protein